MAPSSPGFAEGARGKAKTRRARVFRPSTWESGRKSFSRPLRLERFPPSVGSLKERHEAGAFRGGLLMKSISRVAMKEFSPPEAYWTELLNQVVSRIPFQRAGLSDIHASSCSR